MQGRPLPPPRVPITHTCCWVSHAHGHQNSIPKHPSPAERKWPFKTNSAAFPSGQRPTSNIIKLQPIRRNIPETRKAMPRFQKDRNIFISLPPTHTSLPALWSGACERCQTLGTPFLKMCRLNLSCKTGTPHGLRKQVCTPVGFHSDFPAHARVCPRMQGAFCVYVPCACSTCMFAVHVPYACSMCMLHMHVLYACSMCVLCTHVPCAHSVCMFHMHVP